MFEDHRQLRHRRYSKWIVAGAALIVVLFASTGVLLWKYMSVKKEAASSSTNQTATEDVIAKVDKIYLLPKDEQPTVAQIQDRSKLSGDQQFYKNAQDGDYVLVYGKSKLALIYRESANRLINVMPVNFDQQNPSTPGTTNTP